MKLNETIQAVVGKLDAPAEVKADIRAILLRYGDELRQAGKEPGFRPLYHRALNQLKQYRRVNKREVAVAQIDLHHVADATAAEIEMIDTVLFLRAILLPLEAEIALMLVDGHTDLEVQAKTGMTRRHFEATRESIRSKLRAEGYTY